MWYVYRHIRLDKNIPFYIGIGNKKEYGRAYECKPDKRNIYWSNIYNKTKIEVEILFDGLTKQEAANKEKEFIALYGRMDSQTGILANMTDGGDGVFGRVTTNELRDKFRKSKIGELNPQFGKPVSQETRQKRSNSIKGQKRTLDTKRKQSIASIKSGQAKTTLLYDINDNFIGEYHSLSEACRSVGLNPSKYSGKATMVAANKRNQCKGFKFKYKLC
jgi:hypothetical protein